MVELKERNVRAGTENVVGIAGLGKETFEIATDNLENSLLIFKKLRITPSKDFQKKFRNSFNGRSAESDKSLYTVLSVSLPSKIR